MTKRVVETATFRKTSQISQKKKEKCCHVVVLSQKSDGNTMIVFTHQQTCRVGSHDWFASSENGSLVFFYPFFSLPAPKLR